MIMIEQEQLIGLLKQKGTGKTMSKSLTVTQCKLATDFLLSANCSLTTKTTLLMAFLMLCAQYFHLKVKNPIHKMLPAFAMLTISFIILIYHSQLI